MHILFEAAVFLDVNCEVAELCRLEKETGFCKGLMPRFYFNAATNQCEPFNYGGCGGLYYTNKFSFVIKFILILFNIFIQVTATIFKLLKNVKTLALILFQLNFIKQD